MRDALGRTIDYMRISITDRCNLRCRYCMPEDVSSVPHENILRYEEILRICGIMAGLGVKSFRVTGGEPLVRKGCMDFLRALRAIPGVERLGMTTNGILLGNYLSKLAALPIDSVNISLDTLNAETYRSITGQDEFSNVWNALHAAFGAGLHVKLNCVPVRGVNEVDILPLAALAETLPLEVRFIELMPLGVAQGLTYIPGVQILSLLEAAYPDLLPDASARGAGPARYYHSARWKGRVGFIDALTGHFCADCNRVRLSSEGFLKLCLYHEAGLDLRELLRNGADDAQIAGQIVETIRQKPERHHFGAVRLKDSAGMSKIGG